MSVSRELQDRLDTERWTPLPEPDLDKTREVLLNAVIGILADLLEDQPPTRQEHPKP